MSKRAVKLKNDINSIMEDAGYGNDAFELRSGVIKTTASFNNGISSYDRAAIIKLLKSSIHNATVMESKEDVAEILDDNIYETADSMFTRKGIMLIDNAYLENDAEDDEYDDYGDDLEEQDPELAAVIEEAFEDDDDYGDGGEEDDEESEDEMEDENEEPSSPRSTPPGTLQVLTTQDMHKFAQKIFYTVNNSDDMSLYAAFLQDLDRLLTIYSGKDSAQPRKSSDDSDYSSDSLEEVSKLIEQAYANPSSKEVLYAFAVEKIEAGELVEIAKGKKGGYKEGRSGMLSALMSRMSNKTDNGAKLQSSWDSKDWEGFKSAFSAILNEVVDSLNSEKKEEETASENFNEGDSEVEPTSDSENAIPQNLYAGRNLTPMSSDALFEYIQKIGKEIGIEYSLPKEDFHVTTCFSREPVNVEKVTPSFIEPLSIAVQEGQESGRQFETLGERGALVIKLGKEESTPLIDEHKSFIEDGGAKFDHDSYIPHITISYKTDNLNKDKLSSVEMFNGPLNFQPTHLEPIDENLVENDPEHINLYTKDE